MKKRAHPALTAALTNTDLTQAPLRTISEVTDDHRTEARPADAGRTHQALTIGIYKEATR